MEMIIWSTEMETGIDWQDSQHRMLVEKINILQTVLKTQKNLDKSMELQIKFLHNYVKEHFSDEEKEMQKYHYRNYAKHLEEHQYFIERLRDLEEKFLDQNIILITASLCYELNVWLKKHIMGTDMALADFLKEQVS